MHAHARCTSFLSTKKPMGEPATEEERRAAHAVTDKMREDFLQTWDGI